MLIANVEPHLSRKGILRGAITDGHEWMFLILYLNKNGIGGIYSTSPIFKIQISATYPFQVLSPEPDIIAGIIAHWVCCILFYLVCPYKQTLGGT